MPRKHLMLTSALALAMAALALQGCNQQTPASQQAAQPITGAPLASLGLADAPPPAALSPLPAAAPIRVAARRAPRERYRYVDDAYEMTDAFGDSPPDYTVDYQGARPWIWRAQNGAYRVVEWTPDGERDYYYRAGGDQPFLIRDSRYAYAYDGGELVDVYDSYGRPAPMDVADRQADMAARYLSRARAIYFAAQHQQRQAAYAADWRARRDAIEQPRRDWAAEQQRNEDWRRWHDERAPQDQGGWAQERSQRQNYAAQIAAVVAAGAAGAALQHNHDQEKAHAADQARQQQAQADAARLAQSQAQATGQAGQQQVQADAARAAQAQAQAQARQQQQQAQIDAARRAGAQNQANAQQAQLLARQQAEAANAQRVAQAQAQQNAQLAARRQADAANAQRGAQQAAQQRAQVEAKQQAEAANAQRAGQMRAQQQAQAAAKQQAEAAAAQRAGQMQAQQQAQAAAKRQVEAAAAQRAGQMQAQQQAQAAAKHQAEAAAAQRAGQMQAQQQAQVAAKRQAEAAAAQRAGQVQAQQQAQVAAKQQAEAANVQRAAQAAAAREKAHPAGKPANEKPENDKKKLETGPQK
jgi:hypothetical protein